MSYVGYQCYIDYNTQPDYKTHIAVIESATDMILHGDLSQGCIDLIVEKYQLQRTDLMALSPAVPKLEFIINKHCTGAKTWV
jgi:hypothetical protein